LLLDRTLKPQLPRRFKIHESGLLLPLPHNDSLVRNESSGRVSLGRKSQARRAEESGIVGEI